ncbi:MAG: methyltransferase domain-containing protein [Nevskia sp.]|nr:methyltransferase domain-containing protein [Nevskia sp.]
MPNRLALRGGQPFSRYTLTLWLRSPRGRRLLAMEERELRLLLPDLFGRHILQIGNWGRGQRLLGSADMLHRAVLGTLSEMDAQSLVEPEQLPVMSNSVDAVLLPHTLEFSPLPHNVLRETSRVLTDRGRLLILGFNPWSMWGIRQRLGMRYRAFPAGARFFNPARLCDWLELLDFEVMLVRRFGVGFPWLAPSSVGEPAGLHSLLNPFAECYLIMARKRVIPMSLVGRLPRAQVRPLVGGAIGGAVSRLPGLQRSGEWPQAGE